jgi:hypothetical protein
MGDESLMLYVKEGLTEIKLSNLFESTLGCGIIPIGKPADVCTTGL